MTEGSATIAELRDRLSDSDPETVVESLSAKERVRLMKHIFDELTHTKFECECGHEQTVSAAEPVACWSGEMFELHGVKMGLCPECSNIRDASPSLHEMDDGSLARGISLGEILLSTEEAALGSMRDFNRRIEEAVGLDPDRLALCPDCRTELYREDKRTGPEEPEIGWEYYECPDCGGTFNPSNLESP